MPPERLDLRDVSQAGPGLRGLRRPRKDPGLAVLRAWPPSLPASGLVLLLLWVQLMLLLWLWLMLLMLLGARLVPRAGLRCLLFAAPSSSSCLHKVWHPGTEAAVIRVIR